MANNKTTLTRKVHHINIMTENPLEHSSKDEKTNAWKANVGHFYLSQAYGGYCLMRVVNEGGGCKTLISRGHLNAREMSHELDGFAAGLLYAASLSS